MEHKVLYKSVKKPVGVEITLDYLLEGHDGMEYDLSDEDIYTFDVDSNTIEVTVGGKKVDPKKVKIKLTEVY